MAFDGPKRVGPPEILFVMWSPPSSPSYPHLPYRLARPSRAVKGPPTLLVLREPKDFDIFQHLESAPYGTDRFYVQRSRKAMDYYYASRAFSTTSSKSILSRRNTAGSTTTTTTRGNPRSPARSQFSSDNETLPETISVKSKKRFRIPFPSSPSPSVNSTFSVEQRRFRVKSTTSSIDSGTASFVSHTERKPRGKTIPIPPPLKLVKSNLHSKKPTKSSVIEIVAPGPPRSDSRLSTLSPTTATTQAFSPPPETPSFLPIPEDELRYRRLNKLRRTLGETVPPELIVTPPPLPPLPDATIQTSRTTKLARRASTSLSTFPSSMSSSLGHARVKSREILGLSESSTIATSKPQKRPPNIFIPKDDNFPYNTFAKPSRPPPPPQQDPPSPILFADMSKPIDTSKPVPPLPLSAPTTPPPSDSLSEEVDFPTPKLTRAEKLANRASLSTSVVLPGSPFQQRFVDSPRNSPRPSPAESCFVDGLDVWTPSRPQSVLVSPLVCAQRLSFQLVVDEADPTDTDFFPTSKNPSTLNLADTSSYTKANIPLHLRPDTPFMLDGEMYSSRAISRTSLDSHDPVIRRERRQGWSGEWNQPDMQDVISKLRNL